MVNDNETSVPVKVFLRLFRSRLPVFRRYFSEVLIRYEARSASAERAAAGEESNICGLVGKLLNKGYEMAAEQTLASCVPCYAYLRIAVLLYGVAVDENGEDGGLDFCVGGDSLDLLVGEFGSRFFFGLGHNGDGSSKLAKLVGGGAGQHRKFARAAVVSELRSHHSAVFAVGEPGYPFEIFVNCHIGLTADYYLFNNSGLGKTTQPAGRVFRPGMQVSPRSSLARRASFIKRFTTSGCCSATFVVSPMSASRS